MEVFQNWTVALKCLESVMVLFFILFDQINPVG